MPINSIQLVEATSKELTLSGFGVNFDSIFIQIASEDCPETNQTIQTNSNIAIIGGLVAGCSYSLRYTAECHASPRSNDETSTSAWTSIGDTLCTGNFLSLYYYFLDLK